MTKRMKRMILQTVMIGLIISGTSFLKAEDSEIFITGGMTGKISIADTVYNWTWNTNFVNASESGVLQGEASAKLSPGFGYNYFFTRNMGVRIAASYGKQDVETYSAYAFDWNWSNGDKGSADAEWSGMGDVTVIPLQIGLIHRAWLSENVRVNLFGGATIYITKFNLPGAVGFGDSLDDDQYVYVDWYALNTSIEKNEAVFGAHVGGDLEYRLSQDSPLGIIAGFEYNYAAKREYKWEVIPKSRYDGELENLFTTTTPDIHDSAPVAAEINLSHFRAYGGIKIYF